MTKKRDPRIVDLPEICLAPGSGKLINTKKMLAEFRQERIELFRVFVNRNSLENLCDTPDYVLAEYLHACLVTFATAVNCRRLHFEKSEDVR